MCGFAGYIHNYGTFDKEEVIHKMADRIKHRGPDDAHYYIDDGIALGFRRLSIIDLEGGRQPILNEDGSLVLLFNGEIYHYQELREELIKAGGFSVLPHEQKLVQLRLLHAEKHHSHADLLEKGLVPADLVSVGFEAAHGGGADFGLQFLHVFEQREDGPRRAPQTFAQLPCGQTVHPFSGNELQSGLNHFFPGKLRFWRHGKVPFQNRSF